MTYLLTAFLVVPVVAFGEVIKVDVAAWRRTETGMADGGWQVSGIKAYADGGARFSSASDYALSPQYDDIVTQIVMSVKSSSTNVLKVLTITPTIPEGAASHKAVASKSEYTSQTFSWPESEGVRQFRLQESPGEFGNWGIVSLEVCTCRIESPAASREGALFRDAFTALWVAPARAVRYQVRYASVTRVPAQFETVAAWDFSTVTNTSGNTRYLGWLKNVNPGKLDGLSGENVCMQGHESGHVQIGTKNRLGALLLPGPAVPEEADALTGMLCAWKHPEDTNKPTMPIRWVRDGETNDLATVGLTGEKAEYRFAMPRGLAADGIVLSSTTNGIGLNEPHGRVRVGSFAIVSGYVPGTVTTNAFSMVGATATGKPLKGLEPGEWLWSVRAFDAEGRDSPWTPFRTVVLDAQSPCRPHPGFSILIR